MNKAVSLVAGAVLAFMFLSFTANAQTIPGGGYGGTPAPCTAFGTTAGTCVQGGGALGTPSSGTATNITGLPISTGVSGLGTGVATALGANASGTGAICLASGSACSGAVSSVFSRTGAVTATGGDYSVGQVTGAAPSASPTFTGTLTLPITGSTQCLHVNTSGTLSGTGSDCGSGGGAVSSVFGRSGAVTATTGDYTISQIGSLGTGVATALGTNVGSAAAPVVNGGVLGTPSSGTLTNTTGLPISTGVSGLGTGVATALAIAHDSTGGICTVGGSGCPGGGSGTVTSVATGAGLTGGAITTSGTISSTWAINAQTGTTYTIASADAAKLVTFNNASAVAVTLPNATGSFGSGFAFDVQNLGAGAVTITPTTATINGASTIVIPQNYGCSIVSDGTNYQVSACLAAVTKQGNGAKIQLSTGSTSTNDCVKFDANGNTVDAGAACGSGSGAGGLSGYSDNGVTVTANTYFTPLIGGGTPQTAESAVDVASPSAMTVTNLQVAISTTLGVASTGFTATFRDNGADTALTCTFNPSSVTICSDTTHSVGITAGDLIDWKIVTTGTITGTPTVTIASSLGTSTNLLGTANVWTKQQSNSITTLSISTATFTPDGSNNNYKLTLVHASCPCTLANPSATPVAGTSGIIEVDQSATGSDTITTWGSSYIYAGGTSTITLSTAASAKDFLSYYVLDSTHILLSTGALNATH